MMTKDLFSDHAKEYAAFRPTYPSELVDFVLRQVESRQVAWDCGTGNGQVARALSPFFKKILATDISSSQLQSAFQADNIFYEQGPAEETVFIENTFDLITVGQAIHWFDTKAFFKECSRVGKPGAIVACFGYSPIRFNEEFNKTLDDFYRNVVYDYWETERRMVEDQYKSLDFPFKAIATPDFKIELDWSLKDVEGYMNTWSAVRKYIKANGVNPVDQFMKLVTPLWTMPAHSVYFPVFSKVGRI